MVMDIAKLAKDYNSEETFLKVNEYQIMSELVEIGEYNLLDMSYNQKLMKVRASLHKKGENIQEKLFKLLKDRFDPGLYARNENVLRGKFIRRMDRIVGTTHVNYFNGHLFLNEICSLVKLQKYMRKEVSDSEEEELEEEPEPGDVIDEDPDEDPEPLLEDLEIYCDGASKGNPGIAGCGAYIVGKARLGRYLGDNKTNMESEYNSLILALEFVKKHCNPNKLVFYMDNKVVVGQMRSNWKINKTHLRKLKDAADNLLEEIGCDDFDIKWIPREDNCEADGLANKAIRIQKSFAEFLN